MAAENREEEKAMDIESKVVRLWKGRRFYAKRSAFAHMAKLIAFKSSHGLKGMSRTSSSNHDYFFPHPAHLSRLPKISIVGLLLVQLAACLPTAQNTIIPPSPLPATSTSAQLPSATPSLTWTPTLPPTAEPTNTITPEAPFTLCSPLEGITLQDLGEPDLLKNPFQEPRPGMDDGHHGADFAYWSRGDRKEMTGLPVYSLLEGTVAAVIPNRPPYGYAVMIETPLDRLPAGWLERMQAPTPAPTVAPAPNLFCPVPEGTLGSAGSRSLYLLYAHLNQPPLVEVGQGAACGQQVGEVGTTGRSVNAHLHLETRIGPSDVIFTEMAHYDNAATEGEMRSYCTWRVSGLFQMFDPMQLISLQP